MFNPTSVWRIIAITILTLPLIVGGSQLHAAESQIGEYPTRPAQEAFPSTIWDWLDLLIAPVIFMVTAWWLQRYLRKLGQEIIKNCAQFNCNLTADCQQQTMLEAYYDCITDLSKDGLRTSQPGDEINTIARARTLAVLNNLDNIHKGQLVQFLHEMGLILNENPIINLTDADLTSANLQGFNLTGINLSGANLRGADLTRAQPRSADFTGANLIAADLTAADLTAANLSSSHLTNANLTAADLTATNLTSVDLTRVDLHMTNVNGAQYNFHTLWPADFDPKAAGAILISD